MRVGDCVVDVPLREITAADGSKTRVTVKAIGVLLVLAEHAGRVVSRDALLASVWAGTMPTMDVVTQAVASLRKALGGEAGAPEYVETIPKGGYRLLAPIEWLPNAQGRGAPAPAPSRGRWNVLATTVAGVALLGTLGWSMAGWPGKAGKADRPAEAPTATPTGGDIAYTLLTSKPGLELDPSLSPDGASVAYAMQTGAPEQASAIFVQSAQPAPPRQLTSPPPGFSDFGPRWSPDGRQLMYLRVDRKSGCELRLMPATGGMERVVGRCDRFTGGRYDWLPDGSGIVAGLRAGRRGAPAPLSTLRLATGRWEAMAYPIAPGNVDFDPRFSSDGRRLAFRRNLTRSDIWVMPSQGGPVAQVTHMRTRIRGWDWAPDDRSLLLSVGNGTTQLLRLGLSDGRREVLGRIPATSLDVAVRGGNLVFALDGTRTAMFRYPLPLRSGSPPQPLFPSTGTDLLPSPSPDGRLVAFYSDRSRETRLWIGDPEDPDRLRVIDGFVPNGMHPPQWSADGKRLLVVGDAVHAVGKPGPRVYDVDVASGRSTPIALEGIPYFAQTLPGGRMLVLVDLGSGKWSLRVLGSDSSRPVLAQLDDVGDARFDAATGQVYFVRIEGPGLWRAGPDLADAARLDPEEPAVFWMNQWALLGGKALFVQEAPGCAAAWHWIGPAAAPATGCLDRARRVTPAMAMVPSSDGEWLYATMSIGEDNKDIALVERNDLSGAVSVADATR
jgi:DNA-binding winged helix-turn-helix (wHTH) protein/Tol biopolymer transport system component